MSLSIVPQLPLRLQPSHRGGRSKPPRRRRTPRRRGSAALGSTAPSARRRRGRRRRSSARRSRRGRRAAPRAAIQTRTRSLPAAASASMRACSTGMIRSSSGAARAPAPSPRRCCSTPTSARQISSAVTLVVGRRDRSIGSRSRRIVLGPAPAADLARRASPGRTRRAGTRGATRGTLRGQPLGHRARVGGRRDREDAAVERLPAPSGWQRPSTDEPPSEMPSAPTRGRAQLLQVAADARRCPRPPSSRRSRARAGELGEPEAAQVDRGDVEAPLVVGATAIWRT